MTTYNTGNPIGSTDARDRLDNSENMDILENSTTLNAHADRLGTMRKTRKGMELEHDNQISAHESEHDAQIAAHEVEHDNQMQSFENDFDSRLAGMAFTRVGTFTAGATLTDMRQTLLWEVSHGGDGHEYGWAGSFLPPGKVVAAGSTPATSGGVGAGAWVDRSDETLRSDLNVVVRRYPSVADMIADTSLIVGQIIETIGYYGDWVGTANKPKGGNQYEIVAGSTGTSDGGSFIALNNGLQAKGLFIDGIVNVCQFGAKGDGVTDDTAKVQAAVTAKPDITFGDSGTFLLASGIKAKAGTRSLTGRVGHTIKTPLGINSGAPTYLFTFSEGTNIEIKNLNIQGDMNTQQYTSYISSIESYFSNVTFENESSAIIDGTDFTHGLSGNVYAINTGALSGAIARFVVSDYIPLSLVDKYVLHVSSGFMSGFNCSGVSFRLYDSNHTFLSNYYPNASGTIGQLQMIYNAAYMKVVIGSRLATGVYGGQSSVYDLSKLKIIKLIDTAANLNTTNSPNYPVALFFSSCNNVTVEDNTITGFAGTAITGNNSNTGIVSIKRNTINRTLGGIGGFGTTVSIENNTVDNRFTDDTGALYNTKFVRRDGIGIGGSLTKHIVVRSNSVIGYSWGCEIILPTSTSAVVSENLFDCEHTGISMGSVGDYQCSNNTIRLGSFGNYGIENTAVNTVGHHKLTGNDIVFYDSAMVGYGMVVDSVDSDITNNTIIAPIGLWGASSAISGRRVSNNSIQYQYAGIDIRGKKVSVVRNKITASPVGAIYDTFTAPVAISVFAPSAIVSYAHALDNSITCATGYAISMGRHSTMYVSRNKIDMTYPVTSALALRYVTSDQTALGITASVVVDDNIIKGLSTTSGWITGAQSSLSGANLILKDNLVNDIYFDDPRYISPVSLKSEKRLVSYSVTPGAILPNATYTTVIPASGLIMGDYVASSISADALGCIISAYVNASSQLILSIYNPTASTITFPSILANFTISRR